MNVQLHQVYHSRHPSSPLQRLFSQLFNLPKSLGNRKTRQKVRRSIRLGIAG